MVEKPKIFDSEYRFCEILWEEEPIKSGELAAICAERLDWKKSTTYTVIKRLTERGVIKSENSIVTSIVSREEAQETESREVVKKGFGGSLPKFIAAFTRTEKLSAEEIAEIRKLIDEFEA